MIALQLRRSKTSGRGNRFIFRRRRPGAVAARSLCTTGRNDPMRTSHRFGQCALVSGSMLARSAVVISLIALLALNDWVSAGGVAVAGTLTVNSSFAGPYDTNFGFVPGPGFEPVCAPYAAPKVAEGPLLIWPNPNPAGYCIWRRIGMSGNFTRPDSIHFRNRWCRSSRAFSQGTTGMCVIRNCFTIGQAAIRAVTVDS